MLLPMRDSVCSIFFGRFVFCRGWGYGLFISRTSIFGVVGVVVVDVAIHSDIPLCPCCPEMTIWINYLYFVY